MATTRPSDADNTGAPSVPYFGWSFGQREFLLVMLVQISDRILCCCLCLPETYEQCSFVLLVTRLLLLLTRLR